MFSLFSAFSSEWVAEVPLLFAAQEALLVLRIPGGKLSLELVEAEGLQHGERELQAADDFVFNLLGSAEDVRVVLRKAAHAQQAVHHARALVAIDGAEFAEPHRQIAIRLQRIFVDQDVARAIHRLEAIFGVVELHGVEHVLRVVALVARGVEQLAARHVRRADQRVAAPQVFFAHPVFHLLADDPALRMPEDQPRPGEFLDRKQVELFAQHAMVALLRFFDAGEVGVEILLREKRRAVNALQLLVLFVAQPVGAGDVEQLERLDLSSRRQVRAAAEILKLAGLVDRNFFIGLRELLDEMALHKVAFALELFEPFLARQKFARIGQVFADKLLHFLFDLFEILGSERGRAIKVVEESVLSRGPVAKLGLGKEFKHGSGEQVRGRMPINFKRLRILLSDDVQVGVFLKRLGQVDQIAVSLGGKSGVGQTRVDGLGNVERSRAFSDFFGAAVGELEMNAVGHG